MAAAAGALRGGRYLPNVAVFLIAQHRARVALKDVRRAATLRDEPGEDFIKIVRIDVHPVVLGLGAQLLGGHQIEYLRRSQTQPR